MSTTIDQRVVEMRFDNKHFEQNVSTTLSTLDKLKQSLHLKGASRGLEEVNSAAQRVDLSGIGNSAHTVGLKFSALYSIADQAFRNITNSAMYYGKKIVDSLTIDPIKEGFKEYETQINAVQTILANTKSKGTTLDDVNGALDELNKYADKTIYNFTEMTRNIGTFTAAGVDLDTSVSAIKGIANLAAVSGSTSQQASTAMYQLSQALSSGTVKLMDWNSVVNAGMGGQVFQDALKETARVHGIAIDDIIKKNGSFRDSLHEEWLTSEILTETLAKFTGDLSEEQLKQLGYTEEQIKGILDLGKTANDAATKVKTFTQLRDTLKEAAQSGWAQTWEIIVGDFEEAKELFTTVSEVIGGFINKSAEARNNMLENWKALGGRQALIDGLKAAFEGIISIIKPIGKAFREIFPPITSERLVAICENFRDLADRLKVSDETADKIKRTFAGVFAVVKIGVNIFKSIARAIGSLFGVAGELGGGLLTITANLGDFLVKLSDGIESTGIFTDLFGGLANIIKGIIKWLAKLASSFKDSFAFKVISAGFKALIAIISRTKDTTEELAGIAKQVKDAWVNSGLYSFLVGLWDVVKTIGKAIGNALKGIFDAFTTAFAEGDALSISVLLNSLFSGGVIAAIYGIVKKVTGILEGPGSILESISGVLDGVSNRLNAFATSIKAESLKTIAVAVAILTASLIALTFVDASKIENSLGVLTIILSELIGALIVFSKFAGEASVSIDKTGIHKNGGLGSSIAALIGITISLIAFAKAVSILGEMDADKMWRGIIGVTIVLGEMVGVEVLLNYFAKKQTKIKQGIKAMKSMAFALLMICAPIAILGAMPWDMWERGLIGVTLVLAAMTAIEIVLTKCADNISGAVKGAAAMVIMASALLVATAPIAVLGVLPLLIWAKGLGGAIALVIVMTLVAKQLSKLSTSIGGAIKGAAAMVIMASALLVAMTPMFIIGLMPLIMLAKGLGGAVAVIFIMTEVAQILSKSHNVISGAVKGAAAMVIMASALLLMLAPMIVIGMMPLIMIVKAVGVIAVILAGMAAITKLMSSGSSGTVLAAASIAIMAASINLLVPALIALSLVPAILLVKSLAAIGVALLVIVTILNSAVAAAPVALALAGAFALMGVGAMAFAAALLILGYALVAIAAGIAALGLAIAGLEGTFTLLEIGIAALVTGIIAGIIKGIGAGIIALCDVIIGAAPKIFEAIVVIVVSLCDAILECAPKIVETILVLVVEILDALVDYTPQIVGKIVQLLVGVIDALADALPDLMKSLANLLFSLLKGAIEALGGMDSGPILEALKNCSMLTLIMVELAAIALLAPAAMIGVYALAGVITELAFVLNALGGLLDIVSIESIENAGILMEKVGNSVGKFVGGIIGGIAEGITSSLPAIGEDLTNFMEKISGFIEGAKNVDDDAINGIENLIRAVLLITGTSFLNGIMNAITGGLFGENGIDMFSQGIVELGESLADFSSATDTINPDTIDAASNALNTLVTATNSIPNTGGLLGLITGENSIAAYGAELTALGAGILGFSTVTEGINAKTVKPASEAIAALVNATNGIPNTGGLIGLITGENSIAAYGAELTALGLGVAGFAFATKDITSDSVQPAIDAITALVTATSNIPSTGGLVSLITGDNSIASYGNDLVKLGEGIAGFAKVTSTIEDPKKVVAAADAAKAIADMTNTIPNQGGVVSWFAGDNSVSAFANNLPLLGTAISGFSQNLGDIVPENVTAAAEAAKSIAEMTTVIPSQGGVAAWFSGESGLILFADNIPKIGSAIKNFATETEGITPETVGAAAEAAKKLADMTATIPNQGGIAAWFSGESGIATFASNIPKVGEAIKSFATETEGITPETVTAASNAAKALAEMTETIPNEGGIAAWFSGSNGVSTFAENIPKVGKAITSFSKETNDINPENVSAAASAAKDLAEMSKTVPGDSEKIVTFGTNLKTFASSLKTYFSTTSSIKEETVSASKSAINAIKELAKIDSGNISGIADAVKKMANAMTELANVPGDSASKFKKALGELGKTSGEALVKALQDIKEDTKKSGEAAMNAFIEGAKSKLKTAKEAFSSIASDCASVMKESYDTFSSAGSHLVNGFAAGISANAYKASAKARAMAKAAAEAAEDELDINSPSKVFRAIGSSIPEGFAIGIEKYGSMIKNSSVTMSKTAIDSVRKSISGISNIIDSDMDLQPTIRPVVDLSDVRTGARNIGSLFNYEASVGVNANIGAINSMMNRRVQNGSNDDVVSAIDKLRKEFNDADRSIYNINGITYDDGSAVANAISTLVHAVKINGRT